MSIVQCTNLPGHPSCPSLSRSNHKIAHPCKSNLPSPRYRTCSPRPLNCSFSDISNIPSRAIKRIRTYLSPGMGIELTGTYIYLSSDINLLNCSSASFSTCSYTLHINSLTASCQSTSSGSLSRHLYIRSRELSSRESSDGKKFPGELPLDAILLLQIDSRNSNSCVAAMAEILS